MNLAALRLCSLGLLVPVILVSIDKSLAAKEPSAKGRASAPWKISLTVREGHRVAKPITGRSPLSIAMPTENDTLPGLFLAAPHPATLPGITSLGNTVPGVAISSVTTVSPPLPTLVSSPISARLAGGGFWDSSAAPALGILTPPQSVIAGDSSGTGSIEFVDIDAAMSQLENSSVVVPLNGNLAK